MQFHFLSMRFRIRNIVQLYFLFWKKNKRILNTAMYQYSKFDYVSDPGCNFISNKCWSGSAISNSCIFYYYKILNGSCKLQCINIHNSIMYLIQDEISYAINADPDPQHRTAVFLILLKITKFKHIPAPKPRASSSSEALTTTHPTHRSCVQCWRRWQWCNRWWTRYLLNNSSHTTFCPRYARTCRPQTTRSPSSMCLQRNVFDQKPEGPNWRRRLPSLTRYQPPGLVWLREVSHNASPNSNPEHPFWGEYKIKK